MANAYHEYYQEGRGKVGMPNLGYTAECIYCGTKTMRRVSGRGYTETVYMVNGSREDRELKCVERTTYTDKPDMVRS